MDEQVGLFPFSGAVIDIMGLVDNARGRERDRERERFLSLQEINLSKIKNY